jgi:single-strand DNA-binding protein
MRGLNKVTLIGNLGDDPDVQVLTGDITVAKFSLATTERYTDKNGQAHSETEWHTVILWRSLAELAKNYLKKGSMVYLEGKLKTRSYDSKEGSKRYVTEIIAEQLIMLDKRPETNAK